MEMIGSGKLSYENLPPDRKEILDGISHQIDKFRANAWKENNINQNRCREKDKSRPNNVISILGGRGSGKTSIALTIRDKLSNIKKINNVEQDFILDIIDPSKFNVEDNALGWIIYSFKSYVDDCKYKKNMQCKNYCNRNNSEDLTSLYEKLKNTYIHSRKFYRDNLSSITESRCEYDKVNSEISLADKELESAFRNFIQEICSSKRSELRFLNTHNDEITEPLIIITFDDVDMCPQKAPEILELILNYLNHPNIVCMVLGEYKTFNEALVIDLWNKSNVPTQFELETNINNNSLYNDVKRRADDILGKVLPYNYRFKLNDFNLIDRLMFTPFGKIKEDEEDEKSEELPKLYKLIDKVKIGIYNDKEVYERKTTLLKYFLEPLIDINKINDDIISLKLDEDKKRKTYVGYYEHLNDNISYVNSVNKIRDSISNCCFSETDSSINLSAYSYVLSGNPRGLINLYYKLKYIIEIAKGDDLNLEEISFLYNNNNPYGDSSRRAIGRDDIIYKHNYILYEKLYDAFYQSNIETYSHNNVEEDVRKILSLNTEYGTLLSENSNYKIENGAFFESQNYNVSDRILTIRYNNGKKLSKEKSAFVQLFYDLGKVFLGRKFVENNCWNFENVCLYKRDSDFIQYNSIDFKYFYDYYIFQRLYRSCLPLIIRDRKVVVDARNRLKAIAVSILKVISEDENDKQERFTNNIISVSELSYYFVSDIKNRENTINTIAENYSEHGYELFSRINSIIDITVNGEEVEYYNTDELSKILNSRGAEHILLLNKILCLCTGDTKKSISDRCDNIIRTINEYKDEIVDDVNVSELREYAEHEDWDEIKKLLFDLNEEIVDYLINKIINESKYKYNKDEQLRLLDLLKNINRKLYSTLNKDKKKTDIGTRSYLTILNFINRNIEEVKKINYELVSVDAEMILKFPEEEALLDGIEEFVKRKTLKTTTKEKIINKIVNVNKNEIVSKEFIQSIDTNNFKAKMYELIEITFKKWLSLNEVNYIIQIYKVASEENKRFIFELLDKLNGNHVIDIIEGEK